MQPDKLKHLAAGVIAAVFGLAVGFIALSAGLHPLAAAALLASTVAGLAKEAADWLDNRARPGAHEVSPLDALATAAPGLVLAIVIQAAHGALGV